MINWFKRLFGWNGQQPAVPRMSKLWRVNAIYAPSAKEVFTVDNRGKFTGKVVEMPKGPIAQAWNWLVFAEDYEAALEAVKRNYHFVGIEDRFVFHAFEEVSEPQVAVS